MWLIVLPQEFSFLLKTLLQQQAYQYKLGTPQVFQLELQQSFQLKLGGQYR